MTSRPPLVQRKILLSLRRHLSNPLRLRSLVGQHHLHSMTSHPHLAQCKILLPLYRPQRTTWRLLILFPCLVPPEYRSVSHRIDSMRAALQLPRDVSPLPRAIPLRLLSPKVFDFMIYVAVEPPCFDSSLSTLSSFMIAGFTYGYAVYCALSRGSTVPVPDAATSPYSYLLCVGNVPDLYHRYSMIRISERGARYLVRYTQAPQGNFHAHTITFLSHATSGLRLDACQRFFSLQKMQA